jgi:hypothetical protein
MAGKSADIVGKVLREGSKGLSLLFKRGGNDMVKLKAGGIVLGGFAAYLLLSKGISVVHGCVRSVCESRNWKNYYKYGKEGNMVPPGYSMHTHENENGDTVEVNNGKQPVKQPQEAGKTSTGEALGRAVGEAITKMINDTFGAPKAAEGASEGDLEASEGQNICPHDCDNCQVEKCPYETLKNGGKITKWSEDGRPISGCYPWDEGEELHWWVDRSGEAHSVMEDVDSDDESVKSAQETGKGTDDNIVQLHVDDILVNRKDPGDYDGDIPDDDRLKSDPEIIKMAREAFDKTKED